MSSTTVSHVENMSLISASHINDKSPVPVSHTGDTRSATASHAEGVDIVDKPNKQKLKFPCKFCEGDHLTYLCPVLPEVQKVWSLVQKSDASEQPASVSHAGGKLSANASHAESTDVVKESKPIGRKPKFPCKLCKGDHLTHRCPAIPEARRVWSMSEGTSVPELSIDSLQSDQPLVDKVVEPMQSLVDPTLPSESEVIESMQYSTDPISPSEIDAPTTEVFCITSLDIPEKGGT